MQPRGPNRRGSWRRGFRSSRFPRNLRLRRGFGMRSLTPSRKYLIMYVLFFLFLRSAAQMNESVTNFNIFIYLILFSSTTCQIIRMGTRDRMTIAPRTHPMFQVMFFPSRRFPLRGNFKLTSIYKSAKIQCHCALTMKQLTASIAPVTNNVAAKARIVEQQQPARCQLQK